MHLNFADILNLVSMFTLIGALVFTAMQVRQVNQARRDQAAITMLQTALSQNSALMLEMFAEIPENAPAAAINDYDQERRRAILEFGLRLEVMGFMAARNLLDLDTVNEMAGGVVLAFWSRTGSWAKARRERTGHQEFLEWCEWLAQRVSTYRETHTYKPAHLSR
jgi:hypothetical protein